MIEHERDLVFDLANKSITEEEFLEQYPVNVRKNPDYIKNVLMNSVECEDPELVECGLLLGFIFGFHNNVIPILCELILLPWHFKHEDIARVLSEFKSPESVCFLYKAALSEYDYLDYDEHYSLAVKCIWALSFIKNKESMDKLKILANSSNVIISSTAKERLTEM